jgi:SET domain-containing protein
VFTFNIDATDGTRLGRYINDAPHRRANCIPKPLIIDGHPHVVIFAATDISAGSEIRYDYGVADLPWRKVRIL